MPSLALVDAHRAEVADIVAVAQADLAASWIDLPLGDARATQLALAALLAELVDTYGFLAAGAGADWYAEARADAGTRGRFTPSLVMPAVAGQVDAAAGWSVSPLFGEADVDLALRRAGATLQKFTADADRATILTNTRRDPAGVRWYRGASANCCSFCALTASRGAVYRSEATADFSAHNNCRCFPVALFPGESAELPDYYQGFGDEYGTAVDALKAAGESTDTKSILAEMRRRTGRA